ncbi:hypothetical protein D3C81_927470 [compost metagenome]
MAPAISSGGNGANSPDGRRRQPNSSNAPVRIKNSGMSSVCLSGIIACKGYNHSPNNPKSSSVIRIRRMVEGAGWLPRREGIAAAKVPPAVSTTCLGADMLARLLLPGLRSIQREIHYHDAPLP